MSDVPCWFCDGGDMVPDPDGMWVLYADHAAEVERLQANLNGCDGGRELLHREVERLQAVRRALVRDNRDKTAIIRELGEALRDIASYDEDGGGCCPYGCDTPTIAKVALAAVSAEKEDDSE